MQKQKILLSLFLGVLIVMLIVSCTVVQKKEEEYLEEDNKSGHQEADDQNKNRGETEVNIDENTYKNFSEQRTKENVSSEFAPLQENTTQAPSYDKLDLLNPATITLQNCKDAILLLQKKKGIPIANILLIEKKCEEEYYFNTQIINEIAVKKALQEHTKEDCSFLQNRVLQFLQELDDEESDFLSDKNGHLKKIDEIKKEDIDEDEKNIKIKKQEDEIEGIEDALEDLQEKRTRLKEIDKIFKANC